MKIEVPYGKEGAMAAELDDAVQVSFLEANDVDISDEDQCIADSIANPISSKNFKDFLSDAEQVLVIVNDATRPPPPQKILDVIF